MKSWRVAKRIESGGAICQDRAQIIELQNGLMIVMADGAGGRSGGSEAADMVCHIAKEASFTERINDAMACAELLRKLDKAIEADAVAGESTAIVAIVSENRIYGASVGDSGAWWIDIQQTQEVLTRFQRRKPFLGSGAAMPVPFEAIVDRGILLIATDGLLKYTSSERICETVRTHDLNAVSEKLTDLVRLSSGGLPDDVAVVVCSNSL